MKKVWAPWRIEYIKQPKDDGCFICSILQEKLENDRENLILYRGKEAVVLINKYPYIAGHLMIAPILHTIDLTAIPAEVSAEMWDLTTKSVELLRKAIQPEGFNIGINIGKVSGAGLLTHLHIHIVPRWSGDTNFMPVISNTRAISQGLFETYDELSKYINLLK